MKNYNEILKALEEDNRQERSAWGRGVGVYACELLEDLKEWSEYNNGAELPKTRAELLKASLNGADDWGQFSWGGSSLIYDGDIAERLCTPSELKKTRNGDRRPNAREEWLDTQARALRQAFGKLYRIIRAI